jgi:hypothetical protein
MASSIVESLHGLRDVQGVLGSFVLGRSGKVVCKDLPRVFDDRVFEEVGPRILRLKETLSGEGPGLDNVVIRYSDHKLHLRFLSASVLGVITSTGVNPASLKMALTLSSRRIESDLPFEPQGLSSTDRRSAFPGVGTAATPPLWTDESSPDVAAQTAQEPPLPGPPTLRSPKPSGHASQPPPPQPPAAAPPDAPRRAPILYRGRRIG